LGNKSKLLYFRKAETFYNAKKLEKALSSCESCLKYDKSDIKTYNLKAKVLSKLKRYKEAKTAHEFVIKNTIDILPHDFIYYSEIILAVDNDNYKDAISAIDLGLEKLGGNIITLQLKKLEYLKNTQDVLGIISQYNVIIQSQERKEFLYYEKAKYLFGIQDFKKSNIALQQAKLELTALKSPNTIAIKRLQANVNVLEMKIKIRL